jgi:hypothetical protein
MPACCLPAAAWVPSQPKSVSATDPLVRVQASKAPPRRTRAARVGGSQSTVRGAGPAPGPRGAAIQFSSAVKTATSGIAAPARRGRIAAGPTPPGFRTPNCGERRPRLHCAGANTFKFFQKLFGSPLRASSRSGPNGRRTLGRPRGQASAPRVDPSAPKGSKTPFRSFSAGSAPACAPSAPPWAPPVPAAAPGGRVRVRGQRLSAPPPSRGLPARPLPAALLPLLAAALLAVPGSAGAASSLFTSDGAALAVTTPGWSLFAPLGAAKGSKTGLLLVGDKAFSFPVPKLKVTSNQV